MRRRLRLIICLIGACGVLAVAPGQAWATPSAQNVSASTPQGAPVDVTLHGGSDFDAIVTFSIVSGPTHGSLGSIGSKTCTFPGGAADCTAPVTYTPQAGYSGPDSFTYRVNDGTGNADATASLTVVPTPVLPDNAVANAGTPYTGVASNLIPGATVDWGDGTTEALAVGGDGTGPLSHTYSQEGDYVVTVTNHDGPTASSSTTNVFVLIPGATSNAFTAVDPGNSATLTLPGIQATLTNPGSASGSPVLLIATLPEGSTSPGSVTSASYDVRLIQPDAGDRLVVTFSYAPGTAFAGLFFVDPLTKATVAVPPNFYVVDPVAHTVTLNLDATSVPMLTQLTGTRFIVQGRPQAPRIRGLRVRPHCVLPGAHAPSLRLSLSEAARLHVSVARRKGSDGRASCESHGHARGHGRARFERPRRLSRDLPAGKSRIRLPELTPGAYRVRVTATNATGRSSAARTLLVVA